MKNDTIFTEAHRQTAHAAQLLFRLENVPFSRWHTKARIVVGTATFFDAFDALSLAFVLPVLVGLWNLSSLEIGLLIASGYLGQVIGAILFGSLAERFGRVPSITATVGIMSVISIACAFAGSFQTLFVLRFLQGIGVGGEVPIAASYINELSQAKGRGRFFVLYEMIFPLGLLGAAQIGSLVVPTYGWEYMFLIGGIPGLIIMLFMFRLPESPRWLVNQGRLSEAERVIEAIEDSTPARVLDTNQQSDIIRNRVRGLAASLAQPRNRATWKELFSPFYRSRTLVVWTLWISSYFVANGISNWLPTLYKTIFGLPLQESLRMASVTNVLSVIAVFCCAMLVDRIGRRRWMTFAFAIAAILLATLGLTGAHSPWVVLALASSAYAVMGTATVLLYLYTPEIYPTRMRVIGTGLSTTWLRLASSIAPIAVGALLGQGGIATVFFMFALICLVGLTMSRFMLETTDRALEEISP